MPSRVDWFYHRNNCLSCQRARDFLAENGIAVQAQTDARAERRGPAEALEIAKAANLIHVARGKKIVTINMKKDAPDDETLLQYLLGPSGNLRAPTIKKGKTLFVGFNPEAYRELIG